MEELCGVIQETIRLKLMSLLIKESKQVREAADIWRFPVCKGNVIDGGKNDYNG